MRLWNLGWKFYHFAKAKEDQILTTSSLSFEPDQDAMDNFNAVDLSWVKCTMDPLEVLRHSLDFLQDPSKINGSNHEI